MRPIIFLAVTSIVFLSACSGNTTSNTNISKDTVQATGKAASPPLSAVLTGYLQLKNALTDDNGAGAATAGRAIVEALDKTDTTRLTAAQRGVFHTVSDDIRENASHIGKNGSNIRHQREHFDMLSQDLYQLYKAINPGQTLYLDHCPMYNNNKGAIWLSESREIRNPYLGKEMPDCGMVQAELNGVTP
jgi:hypothetical protein